MDLITITSLSPDDLGLLAYLEAGDELTLKSLSKEGNALLLNTVAGSPLSLFRLRPGGTIFDAEGDAHFVVNCPDLPRLQTVCAHAEEIVIAWSRPPVDLAATSLPDVGLRYYFKPDGWLGVEALLRLCDTNNVGLADYQALRSSLGQRSWQPGTRGGHLVCRLGRDTPAHQLFLDMVPHHLGFLRP